MRISFGENIKLLIISIIIAFVITLCIDLIVKTIYPIGYINYIYIYSEKYDVDPYLVAAIVNVESKFDINAKSEKDARGLMQISPVTGKWASKELELKNFTLESLYDPEMNIMIGCWYLSVLSEEFDNELPLILAAYNGGSGNVNKWLSNRQYSDNGKTLREIPFKETREYVEKVEKNHEMYQKIYKSQFEDRDKNINIYCVTLMNNFKKIVKRFISQHR